MREPDPPPASAERSGRKDPFRWIGAPEDDNTGAGKWRREVAAVFRELMGPDVDGASPNIPELPRDHYDVRDSLPSLLLRTGRAVERAVAGDLDPTAALVLLEAARSGGVSPGSASRRLAVHPATVTAAAHRLERRGLMVRTGSPVDARVRVLEPTADGRRVAELTANDWRAMESELAESGRPGEVDELRRTLRRVLAVLADRRRRS